MDDSTRFPVRFDDDAFAEDLYHATPAGREIASRERARLEREGIAVGELRQCAGEGPDGTRLGGCVKTYLPWPRGPWGIVFTGDVRADARPVLIALAFGVRHPSRAWQPSVYQVAHSRLND